MTFKDQTWGQIHFYLKVFKYSSKYLYLTIRNEKYLYLNTFLMYFTFSNTLSASTFLFHDHM